MYKKLRTLITQKKVWIPLALLIIGGIVAAFFFGGNSEETVTTVVAERGTVREEVAVVGKIQPTERLELGLLSGGRVAYVGTSEGARVRRGQTLVSLSADDLQAQLQSALAGLAREQIRLDQLVGGARSEDIAVTQATTDASKTSRDNARRSLEVTLRETYSATDSTLGTNIDQFFDDPRESSPSFGITIGSGSTTYFIRANQLEKSRIQGGQRESVRLMQVWRDSLGASTPDDITAATTAGTTALAYTQTYLADLAAIINAYRPDSSSQQVIYDGLKADVAAARSTVASAASSLASADSAYRSAEASLNVAERQLDLKTGATASSDVAIQETNVRAAQASVDLARAQIAKNAVVSPVDGIVTELSIKVGENANAASPVVTVMADATLEIEAKVPEADIAKISIDNEARVTLDAYPGETLTARVIYIAPAETIVEGVPTYKIKLQIVGEDTRLKPGMSADLDISTNVRENVIALPQRAIITRDGVKIVRVKEGEETKEVAVRTGIRGVDGKVEITGGLQGGEVIVTSN